jgi:hypothetical protein
MIDNKELCEKIRSIYPEVGDCDMDVEVKWDEEKGTWIVDLKAGDHELQTHLEPDDAEACMEGKQCVNLGVQIAQLKSNVQNA